MTGIPALERRETCLTRLRDTCLHLVLDLEQVLESRVLDPEDLQRLKNILRGFPGVMLTVHTDRPVDAARHLLKQTRLLPDHLLSDSGTVVCHREEGGGLVQDPDYLEWLAFQGNFRPRAGAAKAVGVEFLEIGWAAPRPLVVTGRADLDLSLLGLADLPLLRPGSSQQASPSSFLKTRPFALTTPGLSETLRILLAFLSPERHAPLFGSGPGQVRFRKDVPGVLWNGHSWRIEPDKRLEIGGRHD